MTSKIILLNGPKACGKNVAVDHMAKSMLLVDRRCKDHLFVCTATLFKMTLEEFFVHYEDRETKELPKDEFSIYGSEFNKLAPIIGIRSGSADEGSTYALSVREALIYVSEIVCKSAFGNTYFGTARAEAIGSNGYPEFAIDDSCGFDDEIQPTIDKLGMDSVMLIRIHGRGSFVGDSRNYISDGVVSHTVDVYNTGTEQAFLDQMKMLAEGFYF